MNKPMCHPHGSFLPCQWCKAGAPSFLEYLEGVDMGSEWAMDLLYSTLPSIPHGAGCGYPDADCGCTFKAEIEVRNRQIQAVKSIDATIRLLKFALKGSRRGPADPKGEA